MRLLALTALALLGLLALASADNNYSDSRTRDVCIVGGGAAGMAASVFLKDRGYDTLVLEVAPQVGGHCNTIRTGMPQFSPTGDLIYPGYVDVGVVVYQDTAKANATGGLKGTWSLDSRAFAGRFAPTISVDYVSAQRRGASAPTYLVDFARGIAVNTPAMNATEQAAFAAQLGAAIGRIYAVTLQYPWLNTGKRPDPIPSFFLEPFTNFINNQSLQILIQPLFFGLLTGGGMGSLDKLTTVEALQVLSPVTLDLFTVADSGFVVQGGCQTLYDSIAAFVGSANIRTKATIRSINRRFGKVQISGYYDDGYRFEKGRPLSCNDWDDDDDNNRRGGSRRVPFLYQCRKVVMAIYPVLPNLDMLDLSNEEYQLFGQVDANYYMAIAVNATKGALVNSAFTINNVDITNQPSLLSSLPSLSTLTRSLTAGPVAAYANSDSEQPLTYAQALKLSTDGMAKIPSNMLGGFNIVEVNYHLYDPHFKAQALAKRPSADTKLASLQGQQNTYWIGAATRYDASAVVWNGAYEVIAANFPKRN